MRKLNLVTGIYSLVSSIVIALGPATIFLPALIELSNKQTSESNFGAQMAYHTELSHNTQLVSYSFMLLAFTMIVLGIINLVIVKDGNLAGKILIIIAGVIVIVLGLMFGFVSGLLGIIGSIMLLITNSQIKT